MKSDKGERLQTAASTISTIEAIGSIILAIMLIATDLSAVGVISGILVGAFGCVIAWVTGLFLSCIGEMVENSHIQKDYLKKLFEAGVALKPTDAGNISTATKHEEIKIEELRNNESGDDNTAKKTSSILAHFPSRRETYIKCPICENRQMSSRNNCFSCGCSFVYDDEQ